MDVQGYTRRLWTAHVDLFAAWYGQCVLLCGRDPANASNITWALLDGYRIVRGFSETMRFNDAETLYTAMQVLDGFRLLTDATPADRRGALLRRLPLDIQKNLWAVTGNDEALKAVGGL